MLDLNQLDNEGLKVFIKDAHSRINSASPENEEYIIKQMRLVNKAQDILRKRNKLSVSNT